MQLVTIHSDARLSGPCVATIGFFDGVHAGHRFLISQVCAEASRRNSLSAVVTFGKHPRQVMQSDYCPSLLTSPEEKLRLLEQTGIDVCILLEFTPELSQLTALEFMALLHDRFQVSCLVIGYDHRFGHNRSEGFDDYCRYGRQLGISVLQASAYTDQAARVSSSMIRHALLSGDVRLANRCLGYSYFLEGTVVGGRRNGRKIGFPTANLQVSAPGKLIPSNGVYAVRVESDGIVYGGMLNIGVRPTFHNGPDRSLEVHIFDFSSDIYGKTLRVCFLDFIRPERKFDGIDELIRQLQSDALQIRALLSL